MNTFQITTIGLLLFVAALAVGMALYHAHMAESAGETGIVYAEDYLAHKTLGMYGTPMLGMYTCSIMVEVFALAMQVRRSELMPTDTIFFVVGPTVMLLVCGWSDMYIRRAITAARAAA